MKKWGKGGGGENHRLLYDYAGIYNDFFLVIVGHCKTGFFRNPNSLDLKL
jgi:hypothetical protein